MTPEELKPNVDISRRKMLKRIGAGAAVAWSAPILTSIRTPAFAQYDNRCPDTNCREERFEPCTGNPSGCQTGSCHEGEGFGCFKIDDVDGKCHCAQNTFCSCVFACREPGHVCPLGQFCVGDTGCGAGHICLNCCGEGCKDDPAGSRPRGASVKG